MSEATEAEVTEVTDEPAAVAEEQNTEQVEQTSDPTPDSTEAETTKPPETEEQKRSKYQRRIDRKNSEIAAARTEARLLKERLDQLEARQYPQQRDTGAPKLEQFDNFEDYMGARVAYEAERVVETRLTKAQQAEQARQAELSHHTVMASWQDKQAAAAEKYADFDEVLGESEAPMTPDMRQAIIESDLGPDVAYYLAQHPNEAKAIAQLSPIRQIAAIGRLEAKVSTPAPRKTTTAPAPITPAGSAAKADKDPDQMPVKEWLKWRNEQVKKR